MDSNIHDQGAVERIRLLLHHELERRIKKNPYYSLRKFAYDLDISPSALSRILSKKSEVTHRILKKISLILRIRVADLKMIKNLDHQRRAKVSMPVSYQPSPLEPFSLITDSTECARRIEVSLTISVNTKDLPEVQNEILRFRENIAALAATSQSQEQAYHVSLSIYPAKDHPKA